MTVHIKQHLIARGNSGEVRKVMDHIKGMPMTKNALFDLNRIVPMPPAVKVTAELFNLDIIIGRYEQKEMDAYQQQVANAEAECRAQTGFAGWYDWSVAHWGCKGNAYWIKSMIGTTNELIFHTATLPIFSALQTLSAQFTEVVIELEYIDTARLLIGQALFVDGDGCNEGFEWNSVKAKALRHRLLGEAEDLNRQNLIIEMGSIH